MHSRPLSLLYYSTSVYCKPFQCAVSGLPWGSGEKRCKVTKTFPEPPNFSASFFRGRPRAAAGAQPHGLRGRCGGTSVPESECKGTPFPRTRQKFPPKSFPKTSNLTYVHNQCSFTPSDNRHKQTRTLLNSTEMHTNQAYNPANRLKKAPTQPPNTTYITMRPS